MNKITLQITRAQLDACRKANLEALTHAIRDAGRSAPPADGTVGRIVATLDALSRIEAGVAEPKPVDEIDVGATDKGERVTVKAKVLK